MTGKITIDPTGAIIDRTNADWVEDAVVVVTLPCGHQERFRLTSLDDETYIRRANILKQKEPMP